MTSPFDRSYFVAASVLAVGVLVGVLVVRDLGGALPALPRFTPAAGGASLGPADGRLPELFSAEALARLTPATNLPPPFVTGFFQPPPPPPARKTRKVKLTYQGFFETAGGEKRAFVEVDGAATLAALGGPVVSDLMISNIQRLELTLRRVVTQEVVIPFRASAVVEVPVE